MAEAQDRILKLRVGFFVLALLVAFVVFVLTIGGQTRVFESRFSLRATFSNVEGLIVGAPVRLAGVTVGTVSRVSFSADPKERRLLVEVSVDPRFRERVREDSVASIGTIGLVGDKFLEITVGSHEAKALPPGALLRSVDPPDYFRLLSKGTSLLDNVVRISEQVGSLLGGQEGTRLVTDLGEALRALRKTLADVETGGGLLPALIHDPKTREALTEIAAAARAARGLVDPKAGGVATEAAETMRVLRRTLAGVETGQGLLPALIHDPKTRDALGEITAAARAARALLDPQGGGAAADVSAAARTARELLAEVKAGRGPLHALIYGGPDDPLTRLGKAIDGLEGLVRDAGRVAADIRTGDGLLGALIYGSKDETLGRLARALKVLEEIAAEVKGGRGTLSALIYGTEGKAALASLQEAAKTLQATTAKIDGLVSGLGEGKGLLHALLTGSPDETLGRLARALKALEEITAEVQGGRGTLGALIYGSEGKAALASLQEAAKAFQGTAGRIDELVMGIREGKGALGALLGEAGAPGLLGDLHDVAKDLKRITGRLAAGEGTLGGLLDDPTIYEDLSSLLRGARRSLLLRALIRSTLEEGQATPDPGAPARPAGR